MLKSQQVAELLYQALETEIGGVQVYTTAVGCAVNTELKAEWTKYLNQTKTHERILRGVVSEFGLDADARTPGRDVVQHMGESLVQAMKMALETGDAHAAQLVAAECVVQAETKDHLNWSLLTLVGDSLKGKQKAALEKACKEVEDEEDEHLYHTTGWTRELWIESLGLPAVLPPPEEEKHVTTAIGAARAKLARKEML